METLLRAAEAASDAFDRHWLKPWIEAHHARLRRVQTTWGRRMAVEGLCGDIEKVIEDMPKL